MLLGMRSPKVGPTPVGAWRASTSTLAQLAALATHSRTSLATMFDSTGKLTYAPNNLLLNTATLGTQTITVQVGVNYILSIKGTGSVTLTDASTAGPLNGTGASNRVDLKITAATSSLTLTVAGSVTSARLSAVTYEAAFRSQDDVDNTASAYYGPRIDYDPNTLAVNGLLIEEARTNLYKQSDDLTNAATVMSALSRTTDGTLAPNGVSLMAKMTANVGSAAHEFYQNLGVVSGTVYSASVFVKKGNHRYVFIAYEVASGTNGVLALFDLDAPTAPTQTFAVGGGALVTAGIINEGGGIYRIYVVGSVTGAGTAGYLVAGFVGSSTVGTTTVEPTYLAAGTEYGYFFGGQLEAGSFATSYIPTAAASVTRAADVVQFTGAALTALQGSAGSAAVEHTSELTTQPGTLRLIGTTSSRALIYGLSDTGTSSWNGSVSLNATIGSSGKFSTTARTAAAWSAAGRSIVANGGTVATDANAAFGGVSPAGAWLGSDGGTANWASGWYKSFALYNQRLPDATLQAKSVVGAAF